jgi:hypothetical protein
VELLCLPHPAHRIAGRGFERSRDRQAGLAYRDAGARLWARSRQRGRLQRGAHNDGATVDAEEYAPINTVDFTAPPQRLFEALKDQPGRKIVWIISAGGGDPLGKLGDLETGLYGIELSIGGNILAALAAYKRFPGLEGATYY